MMTCEQYPSSAAIPRPAPVSGGVFVGTAVLAFLLLILAQSWAIIAGTYGPRATSAGSWVGGWGWALLTAITLCWALINLHWSWLAMRDFRWFAGWSHLAIVICCGLVALGLQAIMAARWLSATPIVLDYTHMGRPAPAARPSPVTVVGDAAEGKKLFALSCLTCHGPTGDGLNNLAPSLRMSEFVRTADEKAILRVIQFGRSVTDPANTTGKVMPARGGNPFLTDEQAAHLAAFVKSIPASAAQESAPGGIDPGPQLARWVVPPAAVPVAGMIQLRPDMDLIGSEGFQHRRQQRRQELSEQFGVAAMAVHGLFLLGVLLSTSYELFYWLLEDPKNGTPARLRIWTWGWWIVAVSWVAIVVVFSFP